MKKNLEELQAIQQQALKEGWNCTINVCTAPTGVKLFIICERGKDRCARILYDYAKEINLQKIQDIRDFAAKQTFVKTWKLKAQAIYEVSIRPARGSESGVDDIDRPQIANITAEVAGLSLENALETFEAFMTKELEVEKVAKFTYETIKQIRSEEMVGNIASEVLESDYNLQYDYSNI